MVYPAYSAQNFVQKTEHNRDAHHLSYTIVLNMGTPVYSNGVYPAWVRKIFWVTSRGPCDTY